MENSYFENNHWQQSLFHEEEKNKTENIKPIKIVRSRHTKCPNNERYEDL